MYLQCEGTYVCRIIIYIFMWQEVGVAVFYVSSMRSKALLKKSVSLLLTHLNHQQTLTLHLSTGKNFILKISIFYFFKICI